MKLSSIICVLIAWSIFPVQAQIFQLSDTTRYTEQNGHGYDLLPAQKNKSRKPFYYSVRVPDGNYKVTVTLGSKKQAGNTTVRAESRRLYVQNTNTKKGELIQITFIVNKRTPFISEKEAVRIKDREKGSLTWDDKLTLEFNGSAPLCEWIKVEPAQADVPTLFLCGNSTVVDQTREPWASWGQMIPLFFDNKICFANHAESGLSANSFISGNRLKKILFQLKSGDYVFVEFGHNDQKQTGPGVGAWYSFMTNLKMFIDETRAKGAFPVLITPTQRRRFDETGHNLNTHGEYPDAIRWLAQKENVPLIDLNQITNTLLNSLGEGNSTKAFVHYAAGTFPGQKEALADNTHFSTYGAFEIAKCVITGMEKAVPELYQYLKPGFNFQPDKPDSFESFKWDLSPFYEGVKPDGN
ncbi:MAG: rhamnogalacturonan acetylesterase [Paludibacter sp.]